jgi:hypothetical protein
MTAPTRYVILDEALIPWLLWQVARRRAVGVIAVRPAIPPLKRLLDMLVAALRRRGLVRLVLDDLPELVPGGGYDNYACANDHFAESEPWAEGAFDFADAEARFDRYGRPLKHLACNYTQTLAFHAEIVDRILVAVEGARVLGATPELIGLQRFRTGRVFADAALPPHRPVRAPVAALMAVGLALFALAWIILRTRRALAPPKRYFIVFDHAHHPKESRWWQEFDDAPGGVAVLFRNRGRADACGGDLNRDWYVVDSGKVRPGQIPGLARIAVADTLRILTAGWRLPPDLFWQMIKLPFRRVGYRALFNLFRSEVFFAKDDYNVEHIIRSQELRPLGTRHVGVLHGLPAYPPIMAQYRYLDLDTYFTFGREWGERFYRSRWPAAMQVIPVGQVNMSREELQALAVPRPKDIGFFLKDLIQTEAVLAIIRATALAFPDRTVYVKTKGNPRPAYGEQVHGRLAGLANVVVTTEDSYTLIPRINYAFNEPSSLVVECIIYGLFSYCLVPGTEWKINYFAEFPGLCVRSADDVIAAVRGVEAGSSQYPRAGFAELVELSGVVAWDKIRHALGVGPAPQPLPHLTFIAERAETR